MNVQETTIAGEEPVALATAAPKPQSPTAGPITMRRIGGADDIARLHVARRAAGLPPPLAATHIFELRGSGPAVGLLGSTVIGYGSLAAEPIMTGWLQADVSQADALACMKSLETEAREMGLRYVVVPCTDDCRWLAEMEAMGYRAAARVTNYLKVLR